MKPTSRPTKAQRTFKNRSPALLLMLGIALLAAITAMAQQQITGVPGSPSATTTIDGKQLPPPDPKFGGVIKENAAQSKPWWAPRVVPAQGRPECAVDHD